MENTENTESTENTQGSAGNGIQECTGQKSGAEACGAAGENVRKRGRRRISSLLYSDLSERPYGRQAENWSDKVPFPEQSAGMSGEEAEAEEKISAARGKEKLSVTVFRAVRFVLGAAAYAVSAGAAVSGNAYAAVAACELAAVYAAFRFSEHLYRCAFSGEFSGLVRYAAGRGNPNTLSLSLEAADCLASVFFCILLLSGLPPFAAYAAGGKAVAVPACFIGIAAAGFFAGRAGHSALLLYIILTAAKSRNSG